MLGYMHKSQEGKMSRHQRRSFALRFVATMVCLLASGAQANLDPGLSDTEIAKMKALEAGKRKMIAIGGKANLAHGPGVYWNGCDKSAVIQGGRTYGNRNQDGPCGREPMHPKFATLLENHLHACLSTAAARVAVPAPVKVHLNIDSCYVNRNVAGSGRLSNHAYGKACDLYSLSLFDLTGKRTWWSMNGGNYKGSNKIFYDAFRQCWREKINCGKGSIGIPGSKLGGDGSHYDHLHLEYSCS